MDEYPSGLAKDEKCLTRCDGHEELSEHLSQVTMFAIIPISCVI